jgi:hypothetical protein
MSGDQTYVIRKTERGYEIAGPVLTTPSVFQSEAEAVSLARHLIAAKSGGGHIVHSSGMRDFYQGSKSLTNDGAFQR